MNKISIYYQNCRGTRSKLQNLYLSILSNSYDIIILTETWLVPEVNDNEFIDQRYNVFRCDRNRDATGKVDGGGVLIAILRTFSPTNLSLDSSIILDKYLEQLCITLPSSDRHVQHMIAVVYIPPWATEEAYKLYFEYIKSVINRNNIRHFYIFGDFNLPNIDWSLNVSSISNHSQSGKIVCHRMLLNMIAELNANQVNNIVNINGKILDLLILNTNCDTLYTPTVALVKIDNYHPPFCAIISIDINVGYTKKYSCLKPNYKKANYNLIKTDLSTYDWPGMTNHLSAEDAVSIFYDTLYFSIRNHVPFSKRRANNFPIWFTPGLIHLFKKKTNAWRKWKNYKNISDYEQYSYYRSDFKRECHNCYSKYRQSVEDNIKTNIKSFWSFVANKRNKSVIPYNVCLDTVTSKNFDDACNLFSTFFESVYESSTLNLDTWKPPQELSNNCNLVSDIYICPHKVYNELKRLDPTKGPGPDGIPAIFLKTVADHIYIALSIIYNKCLKQGVFPNIWKQANITPVFKSGSRHNVDNYRPISITSTLSKVFERLVHNEIYPLLHKIILKQQHGFVKRRSTSTNLILFTQQLFQNMNNRIQTDVIYTDFQKAFDKVDHELLLNKIAFNGIRGNLLRWFTSYITNRTQKVVVNGCKSDFISVTSGVPQGSILGPLLFVMFINDITKCLVHSDFLLYADDLKIFSKITSIDDSELVQSDLDRLTKYCIVNKLHLSLSKCQTITFTKNKTIINFSYSLCNTYLKKVSHVKDLGVVFDSKLHFDIHVEKIINNALKMLGFVMRTAKEFIKSSTYIYLYKSLVRPCLEYATQIWNPIYFKYIDMLEHVQSKFLRSVNYRCSYGYLDYNKLLKKYRLQSLCSRRKLLGTMFLHAIIHNMYDCLDLTNQICYICPRTVIRRQARSKRLLTIIQSNVKSKAGTRSPLHQLVEMYNSNFVNVDIFNLSAPRYRKLIIEVLDST